MSCRLTRRVDEKDFIIYITLPKQFSGKGTNILQAIAIVNSPAKMVLIITSSIRAIKTKNKTKMKKDMDG